MSKDHFNEFWDNVEDKSLNHRINNWLAQNTRLIKRLSVTLLSVLPFAIAWIYLVLEPINKALINYSDLGLHDPVVIFSLVGFLFLSMFYAIGQLGTTVDRLFWKYFKEKI